MDVRAAKSLNAASEAVSATEKLPRFGVHYKYQQKCTDNLMATFHVLSVKLIDCNGRQTNSHDGKYNCSDDLYRLSTTSASAADVSARRAHPVHLHPVLPRSTKGREKYHARGEDCPRGSADCAVRDYQIHVRRVVSNCRRSAVLCLDA